MQTVSHVNNGEWRMEDGEWRIVIFLYLLFDAGLGNGIIRIVVH